MSMHLRLKRANQTVFLECEPTDVVGDLVRRLAAVIGQEAAALRLVRVSCAAPTIYDQ